MCCVLSSVRLPACLSRFPACFVSQCVDVLTPAACVQEEFEKFRQAKLDEVLSEEDKKRLEEEQRQRHAEEAEQRRQEEERQRIEMERQRAEQIEASRPRGCR